MEFETLILIDLIVAIPCILYYYEWGIRRAKKTAGEEKKRVAMHLKNAYIFCGAVIAFIPIMLLYFLYVNLLAKFPTLFMQSAVMTVVLIFMLEVLNYYSYKHFENAKK